MSNRKQLLTLLAIGFITLFAFSCKKISNKATITPDIYISGYLVDSLNRGHAFYWKNGSIVMLSNPFYGSANSIVVST